MVFVDIMCNSSVNLREPQRSSFSAKSLDDALELIEDPELTNKVDMVWIVGGSSVYKVSKIICEYKEIAHPFSLLPSEPLKNKP